MNIKQIAFHQGISDWLRFKNRCPYYWRNNTEGKDWNRGYQYAARWNRGG